MEIFAIAALLLLIVATACYCVKYEVPTMISEMYYGTGRDFLFPSLLALVAVAFMPAMMGQGIDCLAFLTCSGLLFVAVAPAYLEGLDRAVHKGGAITAATCGIAWTISACPAVLPPVCTLMAIALTADTRRADRWLFWGEWAALLSVAAATILA